MEPLVRVEPSLAYHPDLLLCKLGVSDTAPLFRGDRARLSQVYPGDVPYNACCTGRYFIHNLKYTAPELLAAAGIVISAPAPGPQTAGPQTAGHKAQPQTGLTGAMIPVQVPQGYTKCSIVCVDETSIITYDTGITKACRKAGLKVLQIAPGHVRLPGYPTGFLGGASGRVGREILFNGDLSAHPDCAAIRDFIESRGLSCVHFPDYPLTDVGSILSCL